MQQFIHLYWEFKNTFCDICTNKDQSYFNIMLGNQYWIRSKCNPSIRQTSFPTCNQQKDLSTEHDWFIEFCVL